MEERQRQEIEMWLDHRDPGRVRAYLDAALLEHPNDVELLELAAECAQAGGDSEVGLSLRMRAFSAVPSFAALRRLAAALSCTARWEIAAEAWLHVARARPLDAQAFAEAGNALSKQASHRLAAASWACACRIQPDNSAYTTALRESEALAAQESDQKGRKHL